MKCCLSTADSQWEQLTLVTRGMRWHPQHRGPFWWLLAPGQLAGASLCPSAPSKIYDWLDVGLLMGITVSIFLWPHSIKQHNDVGQYNGRNGLEATSEAVTECAVFSDQSSSSAAPDPPCCEWKVGCKYIRPSQPFCNFHWDKNNVKTLWCLRQFLYLLICVCVCAHDCAKVLVWRLELLGLSFTMWIPGSNSSCQPW